MSRKMKDSGIEWIGEIPKDWEVNKISQIYRERTEKVNDIDYPPLSVTMKGVMEQLNNVAKSNNHDNRKLVCKVDFVINSRSDRRGSCGIAQISGSVSLINTVLEPREKMNPFFYNWLFHNSMFSDEYYKWGHGIVDDLWTTNWNDMKRIIIPEPPILEQQKIADFLDRKVGEIDKIIENTKESIEEYKKYKQAIITEAVTTGLNDGAEMKDSGIEWIGEIPKDWEIIKAKYVVNITNGSDPKTEGGIPVYGSGAESFKTCGEYKEGPTVLIGRKGATLHIPHYILGRYWNVDTAFDVKPRRSDYSLKYYFYLATCFDYKYYISQTTLPSMTQTNYGNMFLPFPPYQEQEQIVNYIDERCSKIDILIYKKEKIIGELENYKKSMIYEYVTGKKEVV